MYVSFLCHFSVALCNEFFTQRSSVVGLPPQRAVNVPSESITLLYGGKGPDTDKLRCTASNVASDRTTLNRHNYWPCYRGVTRTRKTGWRRSYFHVALRTDVWTVSVGTSLCPWQVHTVLFLSLWFMTWMSPNYNAMCNVLIKLKLRKRRISLLFWWMIYWLLITVLRKMQGICIPALQRRKQLQKDEKMVRQQELEIRFRFCAVTSVCLKGWISSPCLADDSLIG